MGAKAQNEIEKLWPKLSNAQAQQLVQALAASVQGNPLLQWEGDKRKPLEAERLQSTTTGDLLDRIRNRVTQGLSQKDKDDFQVYEEVRKEVDAANEGVQRTRAVDPNSEEAKQQLSKQVQATAKLAIQLQQLLNKILVRAFRKKKLTNDDVEMLVIIQRDIGVLANSTFDVGQKAAVSKLEEDLEQLFAAVQEDTGSKNEDNSGNKVKEHHGVKITEFDNSGKHFMSASMWIKKARLASKINDWSDLTFRRMLKLKLIGQAETITQGLDPEHYDTADSFIKALVRKLVPKAQSEHARQQFQMCEQKLGQQVKDFWAELKYWYSLAYPDKESELDTDTQLIDIFLGRLKDLTAMKAVMRGRPATYDQALDLVEDELGIEQRVAFNKSRQLGGQSGNFNIMPAAPTSPWQGFVPAEGSRPSTLNTPWPASATTATAATPTPPQQVYQYNWGTPHNIPQAQAMDIGAMTAGQCDNCRGRPWRPWRPFRPYQGQFGQMPGQWRPRNPGYFGQYQGQSRPFRGQGPRGRGGFRGTSGPRGRGRRQMAALQEGAGQLAAMGTALSDQMTTLVSDLEALGVHSDEVDYGEDEFEESPDYSDQLE